MSTGGRYVLTGTIGQPDAGWTSGSEYEVLGGFWPGGPLGVVNFESFAMFAEQLLAAGSLLTGDLDGDSDVDLADLGWFADYWLDACPFKWRLRPH